MDIISKFEFYIIQSIKIRVLEQLIGERVRNIKREAGRANIKDK